MTTKSRTTTTAIIPRIFTHRVIEGGTDRLDMVVVYRDTPFFSRRHVSLGCKTYDRPMPKLWTATIEAHRSAVRDAVLDAAGELIETQGFAAVTMKGVAETTGVGRATVYKYFRDVESILIAWHERQILRHLAQLAAARDEVEDPVERLVSVLATYGRLSSRHHPDMAALLHRAEHVAHAEAHLLNFVAELTAVGAAAGHLRTDVNATELARFCIQAVRGGGELDDSELDQRAQLAVDALRPR